MHDKFGCVLVIAVEDAKWEPVPDGTQELPTFEITVGGGGDAPAQRALECLVEALGKIRIDLRKPTVSTSDRGARR